MLARLWIRRLAVVGAAGVAIFVSTLGCGSSSDGDEPPLDVDYDSGITGGIYDVVYTQQLRGGSYQSSGYGAAVYGIADENAELAHQCQNDGYGTQATTTGSNAACTIIVCTDPVADADDDGGVAFTPDNPEPSSGTVTLKTALVPAGVTMTPDKSGICTTGDDPIAAQWWTAGDTTIAIGSTGAAVPGFTRSGLIGPGNLSSITLNGLELTSGGPDAGADDGGDDDPEQSFTGPTAIVSRSKPVTLAYVGGQSGTLVHLVLQTSSVAQESIIDCRFDATQGSQTLAAADLASLQATDDGDVTGQYYVDTLAQSAVKSGVWNIQTRLVALGPDALLTVGN